MPYDAQQSPPAEQQTKRKTRLSDDDFLQIVRAERLQAVGMEEQNEILQDRIQALDYFKGEMSDAARGDPVAMPGRSQVVSTDVRDAILTALPDLVEIFLEGIGNFRATNEQDELAAKQETQVVSHVIMNENDGFLLVYEGIMDALTVKTGVYTWWVEKYEKEETEGFVGQTAMQVQAAGQSATVEDVQQMDSSDVTGEPLYSFTARRKKSDTCFKVETVAPEDFAVARDTTSSLRKGTYCVMRTRPRAQQLKAMGFPADLVDDLPAYSAVSQQEVDQARDTAGENENIVGVSDTTHDLRQVIVYVHTIVLDAYGDGELKPWRIVTDEMESVLLDKEELSAIPFAGMTPFKVPHRWYGLSLADVLIEIQKIKTALTRMHLDGGFFSLNARMEVSMQAANEHTLVDLLNNTPGYPVRSKDGQALRPLMSSKSDFNALDSLEYFATEGEKKSGIVRNAQGLNPDTLHDTAGGAAMLISAAQKRLRFIARVLAETGFKDLYLGVHDMVREHGATPLTVRLNGSYTPVDPTKWGARKDFSVEIGSGGREQESAMMTGLANIQKEILEGQVTGAIQPAVVTAGNVYALASDLAAVSRPGMGEKYFTDPATQPPPQPKPDPEMIKAQMAQQTAQAKMAQDAQHVQMEFQKEAQIAQLNQQDNLAKTQAELEKHHANTALETQKLDQQAVIAQQQHERETTKMQLEAARSAAELALKQRELDIRDKELGIKAHEIQSSNDIEHKKLAHAAEQGDAERAVKVKTAARKAPAK